MNGRIMRHGILARANQLPLPRLYSAAVRVYSCKFTTYLLTDLLVSYVKYDELTVAVSDQSDVVRDVRD